MPQQGRRLAAVLAGALVATALPGAEVYKWVDADGVVHYGDKAPGSGNSRALDLDTAPSGVDLAPATGARAAPPLAVAEDDLRGAAAAPSPSMSEPFVCHGSLRTALDAKNSSGAAEASEAPLGADQQVQAAALLQVTTGRWEGRVMAVECPASESSEQPTSLDYRARVRIERRHRGPWLLEAQLDAETGEVEDHTRWLQLQDGLLYFGTSDTTETTEARWRVTPLAVDSGQLTWGRWYRQQTAYGQSLARTDLRTLRAGADRLELVETAYLQGQATGYRRWTLQR